MGAVGVGAFFSTYCKFKRAGGLRAAARQGENSHSALHCTQDGGASPTEEEPAAGFLGKLRVPPVRTGSSGPGEVELGIRAASLGVCRRGDS